MYGVFGTGTHYTGSSMYPLNSNSWEGNECLKCITCKNGITIIDQYFFKDLRETGGGGANQTLLILGSNIPLEQTISALSKITDTLPYS
jgi:hypothetical protein